MGLVDFQILFEKPLPTYFPGEIVNGQLIVNLSSEKSMQRIKVRIFIKNFEKLEMVNDGFVLPSIFFNNMKSCTYSVSKRKD